MQIWNFGHLVDICLELPHNNFQQYALFERIKLFYVMSLALADSRWRHTTHYPGVQPVL